MDPNEAATTINGQSHQSQILGAQLDPNLFKAAAEGNIEPFKEKAPQHLELLVTQFKNNTILHINIRSQERKTALTKFVEQILDICPSLLWKVNSDGDSPLHAAAQCGHSTIAEVIVERAKARQGELESGLRPVWEMLRMTNNEGNTALHEAVRHGRVSVVELLTKEADPDFSYSANDSGQTPLYLAATAVDSSKMVPAILGSCTSPAHEGPNGRTALHVAAKFNDLECIKELLEKKKSLTIEADGYGWTPLHYAGYYNHFSVAKLLLDYDISAPFIANKDRKLTALHMAAGQGYIKIIESIISYCPECCELLDSKGWNFLHYAVISLNPKEFMHLYNNYPFVRKLINEKNLKGNTPLHLLTAFNRNSLGRLVSWYKLDGIDLQTINNHNIRVSDIHRYGFDDIEKEIQELTKYTLCNGQYPKGVLYVPNLERFQIYDTIIELEKARESHLLVAALIATVTFTAAFTLPGGYESGTGHNKGTATLIRNPAFQAFIITDSIAMIVSLSAVFVYFVMSYKGFQKSRTLFFLAENLIMYALAAMVIAFVTGIYGVLEPSPGLAISTCLFLSCFSLIMYCKIAKIFYSWEMEVRGVFPRRILGIFKIKIKK